MTTPDGLSHRVRTGLQDTSSALWLPELTADLIDSGWEALRLAVDLDRDSYGTARVLLQDPEAPHGVVSRVCAPPPTLGCECVPVEVLPLSFADLWAGPGLGFFDAGAIQKGRVTASVEGALGVLATVPSVLSAVCALVRSLHLIDTGDDEVDVSFSDPGLPFSAFVSVPRPSAEAGPLRVAEALLHEAMHLQLTLVEAVVPLVNETERTYFSPWKDEYRTAQGVLHALYVFRVIDAFLGAMPFEGIGLELLEPYARERRKLIAEQVREVRDFHECEDLTEAGTAFVKRLLV